MTGDKGAGHWQRLYRAALLEVDRGKLDAAIELAEQSMRERMQQIATSGKHSEERHAIDDALRVLKLLKR
jgi:hypothetical protein